MSHSENYLFGAKYIFSVYYCFMTVRILDFEAFGQSSFQVGLGPGLVFSGLGLEGLVNITVCNTGVCNVPAPRRIHPNPVMTQTMHHGPWITFMGGGRSSAENSEMRS